MKFFIILHRKLFSFLYLFLIELRTYQRQTICGVLTESRFLKQDFNGSISSWLESWLSWVDFILIVGSREFDPTGSHHRRKRRSGRRDNWQKLQLTMLCGKRKVFSFGCPYWKDNLLRHNLDVMHIEKNVMGNILGTILNIKGKTASVHRQWW